MDKAMRLIETMPRIIPLAARVDGIYFAADSIESVYHLEAVASRHQYPVSERSIFATKECKVEHIPLNPQTWQYKTIPAPVRNRWFHATPEKAAFLAVNKRESWWNNQTYEEQVALAIIDNTGGLVTGPAGTGKSVILKQLRTHLKGEKVFTCAYTHAAARLTGGMTV